MNPIHFAGVSLPKTITPPPESHMLPLLRVRADGLVALQSPTTLGEAGTKEELNFHFFKYLSINKISLVLQNIILNILQVPS